MGYTLIRTAPSDEQGMPSEPGAINGGMFSRQPDIASPVVTVEVADMDAALAEVQELGGTVVRGKEAVGDMASPAYFTDSKGNPLGLWQLASSS